MIKSYQKLHNSFNISTLQEKYSSKIKLHKETLKWSQTVPNYRLELVQLVQKIKLFSFY